MEEEESEGPKAVDSERPKEFKFKWKHRLTRIGFLRAVKT
jgi:hypothetical protein